MNPRRQPWQGCTLPLSYSRSGDEACFYRPGPPLSSTHRKRKNETAGGAPDEEALLAELFAIYADAELLLADWTFLTERLAKHYGVPGVRGPAMRRVALGDARPGGLLAHAGREGFVSPLHRRLILVEEDPDVLLDRFAAWEPPAVEKWVDSRGA